MSGRDRLGQHPAGADPHDGQRPEFHLVRRSGFPPRAAGGHRLYGLPGRVAAGETLRLELRIRNPYPYAIRVGADDTQLVMLWKHGRFRVDEFPTGETFTIPADSELTRGVTFTVLPQLAGETFDVGFALRREGYTNWFNGKSVPTEVGNL